MHTYTCIRDRLRVHARLHACMRMHLKAADSPKRPHLELVVALDFFRFDKALFTGGEGKLAE